MSTKFLIIDDLLIHQKTKRRGIRKILSKISTTICIVDFLQYKQVTFTNETL